MPKPNREPSGRNSRNTFPESKAEVESYLSKKRETAKQETPKSAWSLLPDSLQEIEERKQKQYQSLQKQKENMIPTATGNMDAERAGYNKALAEYGNYWGDKAAYDEGFANYKAALDRLNGQYDSHAARHLETDKKMDAFLSKSAGMQGAGNRMADADRRFVRDTALYNRMGKDANTAGDYALYNRAAQGYNKAVSDYATNYGQAQSDYWNAAKKEQPGYYYAQTMSADEVNAKLEELKEIRAKVKQNAVSYGDEFNRAVDEHDAEKISKLKGINSRIQDRLNALETEIAYYDAAKRMQDRWRGEQMYEQYLGDGKVLSPEMVRKAETGKARYEADRKAAAEKGKETKSYGLNVFAKARAVWRQEKDYLDEAGWDSTFDTASNLNEEDKMLFYGLYADDPEQAMFWARYANDLRNEEYEGQMQEWAHENGWNATAAFFQALGNRIGSGVANLIDPHSATANQMARTASGLLAGGGQLLNEWSGTINVDVPIARDIVNGKGLGDFYQLANSILESGINAYAAGKLGAFIPGGGESGIAALGVMLMGSSASAADYNECIKRGLTPGQAQKHALAAGINEALFEYVSMDKLIDTKKLMAASTVGEKIKAWFVQSGVEASEEFCTTVANRLADAAQARRDGYDNSIEQRAKELIALGMSRDEAMEKAEKEWLTELINDAIGGFISGGFHDAAALAITAPYRAAAKVTQTVKARNAVNNQLAAFGSEVSADEAQALRAYAEKNNIDIGKAALNAERTDSSPTAQNDTETEEGRQGAVPTEETSKKSTRETRAERKANRALGKAQVQIAAHITQKVSEAGLNSAEQVYSDLVTEYGEGISRTAQAAVSRVAVKEFSAKYQTSNEAANTAYKEAMQAASSEPVRSAIKTAWTEATREAAMQGDTTAMQAAITGSNYGRTLNLSAEVTTQDGETKQVSIDGLGAQKNTVLLDSGETVSLDDLQGLDADTKDVIQRLDRFDLGKARPLAFAAYQLAVEKGDVTDGVSWVMNWAMAYDQGRTGYISVDEAIKRSPLPADVVRSAYEKGETATEEWRQQKEAENAEKRKKATDGATGRKGILDTGNLTQKELDGLSADKKDALHTLELLAEATGVDIRLIKSKITKRGNIKGYQGKYSKDGNFIEIDINAGLNNIFKDLHTGMTAVLGHELTHWMQENAPTEYVAYKKAALQAIASTQNGEMRLERMIEAQIRQNEKEGKKITRSEAEDEIVADASMKRLGDTEFWDAVADNLGDKKADVFAKIKEYISKFFDRVREIIGRASHTSEAAQIIDRVEAEVQANLRRLYAEGIGAAMRNSAQTGAETKNAATEGGEWQYSFRSGEYWKPQLTQKEWSLLNWTLKKDLSSGENYIDDETKWVYNNEKGVKVFAIYGFGDGTDATPLYATGGKEAETDYKKILLYEEGNHATYKNRTTIDRLLEDIESERRDKENRISGNEGRRENAGNVQIPVEEPGSKRQGDYGSGKENRRADLRDIVKFSTRPQFEGNTPVEVVRDLVAVHNMTEQNLRDVLELGGFPSPSIAIVKAANGHTNYGPISVVFGRDSIDPALDSRNKVYGADAWTPTAANAQVDTQVNYDVRHNLDRAIYGLSQKTAGGKFARSALFSGFLDDVTRMSADEILDRAARSEAAIAAYLADKGETVEPIYQQKNVSTDRWGNKLLGLINDVIKERGYEAQIYDLMNSGTLVKANEDLTGIVREALERQIEQSSKKPEPIRRNLQRRLDLLNDARVEELLLNAWAYQNEGERTEQEFDYAATLEAMKQKIDPEHRIDGLMEDKVQDTVKAWLRPQIEGLLGKKGIRNERDKFTASGSERSFNALHDAYTLENIVKAMNRSAARGSNTFGVTSGSLQSVTAPEYRSIDEIKKNKNRLAKVEDAKYKQLKADVETEISEIIDAIYNSKDTSDGYISAVDEIGEALISAARTNRATTSIQNVFARDTEYKLSKENAQRISDLYKKAAALPTEYFEAKPQRAMGFDEVKAVILPSNMDHELVQGLQDQGVPVYFFQTGNDAQRTEILNSLDDAKFSTRADTDYLAAVERGDLETAQEMVDKAAKAAGYDIKAYHGTPNGTFTVFRDWQYFTENKEYADVYQNQGASSYGYKKTARNPKTYEVYIKPQNAFDTRTARDRAIFENEFYRKWGNGAPLSDRGLPDWTDGYDLVEFFEENGYDYDAIYLDEGGTGGYGDEVNDRGISIVVKDSAQIKSADPVTYDDSGKVIPLSERFNPKNEDIRYATRDYSDTSDLDLALSAADEIVEGGGDEYWASLLESDPGIAGEAEEIKRLGKQLKKTEADLAEARRNLTLTDRKLKTRGIASLAATIMQDQKAGDINKKDVKNRIAAVLTEAYQKALDQLDAGADVSDAWETVYQEGVVKAADILLTDATYAEKHGYGWLKTSLGQYLGEGAREYVEADIAARVAQDFDANRYRPGQKGTVADRLVAQAENRVNKKLDAAKAENATLKAENAKLTETKDFYKEQADTAKATAGELYQQLLDKREELKNNTKISAEERKKTLKKLDNLQKQMQAKRKEAQAWKEKAKGEAKKVNQAIREKEAAVAKLEKQLQRERDILEGKLKPPAIQKMLAAAREREGKRIAEQKDERFAKYKEKQSAAQLRSRIKNLSDEMKRKMTKPTDGSYVPASLYGAMTRVADLLDNALVPKAGTKAAAKYRAMMDAIHALQSEYGKVAEMDDYTYKSEFDAEIMDEIKELEEVLTKDQSWIMRETGDNRSLREYSMGDLTRIYDILRTINEAMTSATHFLGKANFQSIWDAMGQIAKQQGDMTSFNRLGWYGKKKRMRMLDSLDVMRAVEMMSSWDRSAALYRIMQQVENGVDVSNAWMMEYNKAMQALKTGKNEKAYRDALTKKLDFNVTDEEGLPVLMTKMQALQLLMTAEREAHNDKLVHLQRGGATIRDALAIQDGKKDAAAQTIKVTPELIQRIQDSLTEWDKAYMKAVREYFGREGKATNRVLYNLKHRVLQTEDYYVPYNVDKNYLDTNLDETQAMNMWVKTPGSTNALQKKASQPVIIDGMDTVMAKHVREIADYIGLAIPIRDFAKVYNGRLKQGEGENPLPVKQTIDKNWKAKGQHLLTQSIIDVQGGSRGASWSTAIAEHLNALQSAFVKSALLINPSVTIKQAASYAAAGSILSHAALDRANHPISVKTDESHAFDPATGLIGHIFFAPNGATAMRIYNEIDKHTSLHYMRRQGMSQAELANEANRSGKLKRAMNSVGASMEQNAAGHIARKVGASLNPVSWIQRMDVATTATLWLACKEQARMDGMKVGTEDYWQHVTELYERVIRETQPMYDSLHRNAGQKSRENSLMQYLFPFRTVPIQNHGQIAASYETLQAALKSKDEARIKDSKKFFAKTMWAQTESAIIFSLMTFLAAALKRKTKKYRDDDEEISLEFILRGIGSDTAGTMFSNLFPLFGSAIWDSAGNIYDSVKTGKKVWSYDAYSVGVVDLMNEFAKAGESLVTDAANMIAGKDVGWDKLSGDIAGLLEKSLKCIGIPASTIKTYTEGFIGNLEDLKEGRIPALNDESWERSAAVNANRYLKAWIADDDAKLETVKAEMMGNYKEAGKDEEEANKAMKTKLTATAKDAFADGTLDETDAILFLAETGYYDENEAWNKVRQWAAENEHEGDEEYKWNQYEDLRAAFEAGSGIEEAIKELEDHGYSDTQLANEISDNIRDALTTGAISEKTAIDYLKRFRDMDEDKAWKKVQEWKAKAEHADEEDYSYSQYDTIDEAIDANKDIKNLVDELTAHGVKADSVTSHVKQHLVDNYVNGNVSETALRNQLSRYCGIVAKTDVDKIVNDAKCRKATGYAYSSLDEEYKAGNVTKSTMKNALVNYGGMTNADADKKIRWYDLQTANPSLDITESISNSWYDGTTKSKENGHESAKAAGMSIEAYLKAKATLDEIKDSNDNGTGEDEVIAAIAKMNLSARQKDALYYERYKGGARKGIRKTW